MRFLSITVRKSTTPRSIVSAAVAASTDLQEGTSNYDVTTNNNLFGVQVGSRARHSHGRWSWEGTGKAGIFGNAADQHSAAIVDFPAFVVRPARSESTGDVAF